MALKSKEKILLFFAVIAIAIWLFDWLYYTPQKKKILQLREEIKAADLKLKELMINNQGTQTVEAEVSRLDNNLQELRERMLQGAEFRAFLKHLARESARFQMKMISLTPQEEKISIPEGKRSTSTFQYRRVTVNIVLHSTYSALTAYLQGLEELSFLTVDHLQIERDEKILPFLKVTLGLSVHIISA